MWSICNDFGWMLSKFRSMQTQSTIYGLVLFSTIFYVNEIYKNENVIWSAQQSIAEWGKNADSYELLLGFYTFFYVWQRITRFARNDDYYSVCTTKWQAIHISFMHSRNVRKVIALCLPRLKTKLTIVTIRIFCLPPFYLPFVALIVTYYSSHSFMKDAKVLLFDDEANVNRSFGIVLFYCVIYWLRFNSLLLSEFHRIDLGQLSV